MLNLENLTLCSSYDGVGYSISNYRLPNTGIISERFAWGKGCRYSCALGLFTNWETAQTEALKHGGTALRISEREEEGGYRIVFGDNADLAHAFASAYPEGVQACTM
jgi:hypothetical protein